MIKNIILLACICSFLLLNAVVAQPYYLLLTPSHEEGTLIKIDIEASAEDGFILERTENEEKQGSMSIYRNYQLERKTLTTENNIESEIHYNIISARTDVEIKLEEESVPRLNTSELTNIQIKGNKTEAGEWQFSVEGKPLNPNIATLVSELQAYENRKWFSGKPVKIGDTWKIYPAFTDFVMTRDLQHVNTEGTMELMSVNDSGKDRIATLKMNATSTGWDEDPVRGRRKASFTTQGLLQFSLNQGLDINLVITSQLESIVEQKDSAVTAILPFTYKIKKSIVK